MSEETKRFDVIFECDAINPGRMRTDMKVRMLEPDPFECDLATDEMGFHGVMVLPQRRLCCLPVGFRRVL